MIDASREIRNALKNGLAAKRECKYYPCHFEGQDCTWCFCPFYPCSDEAKGKFTVSRRSGKKVWSCKSCGWIHERSVAEEVLTELRKSGEGNEG